MEGEDAGCRTGEGGGMGGVREREREEDALLSVTRARKVLTQLPV